MTVLSINYNDFLLLTPSQLSLAFYLKHLQVEENLNFQMYQTRLINFYSFIAMAGSNEIKKPEDLYKLKSDIDSDNLTEEQKQFLLSDISEEDSSFLRKLAC